MRNPSCDVRTRCRSAALLSTVLVVASTTGTPAVAVAEPRSVGEEVDYGCRVDGDGWDEGPYYVTERITVPLPTSVAPGQRLGERDVEADWDLSGSMHELWLTWSGVRYEGISPDTELTLRAGGSDATIGVAGLVAPFQEIPQSPDDAWHLTGEGTLGAFAVPRSARPGGRLGFTMPTQFTFNGVSHGPDGTSVPHRLTCSSLGNPAMGAVKIAKASPRLRASVKPKPIVANRTRARVAVRVKTPPGVRAQGKVRVSRGANTLGRAKVRHGRATIRLHRIATPGKTRLRITYAGNPTVKKATTIRKVHVVKR